MSDDETIHNDQRLAGDYGASGVGGSRSDRWRASALIVVHILSPEFSPLRHTVSEYAYGWYGWVLPQMFLSWEIGSWARRDALERGAAAFDRRPPIMAFRYSWYNPREIRPDIMAEGRAR